VAAPESDRFRTSIAGIRGLKRTGPSAKPTSRAPHHRGRAPEEIGGAHRYGCTVTAVHEGTHVLLPQVVRREREELPTALYNAHTGEHC